MSTELLDIYKKFARDCSLLTETFDSTLRTNNECHLQRIRNQFIRELCVVRLHDAWNRFCRQLIVLSAGARPRTANGVRITRAPRVRKYEEVIKILISTYHRKTTEPAWHNPTECLDAARRLRVSNYLSINQGLSLSFSGPAPTTQLTAIRNYFAHRNSSTSRRVKTMAQSMFFAGVPIASDIVASIVQSGTTLFSLWVIRLKQMAHLSIQ